MIAFLVLIHMKLRRYLLKQTRNDDCGATALRMLLAKVHQSKAYLTMALPHKVDNFLLMKKVAASHGVEVTGYAVTNRQTLATVEGPFILQLKVKGTEHFVLAERRKTRVEINDPKGNHYYIPLKTLQKYFISNILVVNRVNFSHQLPRSPLRTPRRYFLISALFLLFVSIGVSLVGFSEYDYLSYMAFTLAAIFKIIEQAVLLNKFITFDLKTVGPKLKTLDKSFENAFLSLQKAKEVAFSYPLSLFASLTTLLLMSILLVLNQLYLVIIALFCVFAALFITLSTMTSGAEEWDLEFMIHKLYLLKDNHREGKYQKIILASKKIGQKRTYVSIVMTFLIAGNIILLMAFTNTYSLNYFIFYFFGFSYYFSEAKKLFALMINKSDYYQAINILRH